jgi:hypothetical protein
MANNEIRAFFEKEKDLENLRLIAENYKYLINNEDKIIKNLN